MFETPIIAVCALLMIPGLIYGMFGYGYALVSVAILPFFTSVKLAVPMIAIQVPVLAGFMLYDLRPHLTTRFVIQVFSARST